jgi:hypothetical protein
MANIFFSLFFVAQANEKICNLALGRQSTLKLNQSQSIKKGGTATKRLKTSQKLALALCTPLMYLCR